MSQDHTTGSVAALLPAWQAAEFIQETLDCLSAQTHENLEVIVSVDLCDDGTYEICQAHAERDPRFRVLRQQNRQGYVGNCNFLLSEAKADYAVFAFHDDVLAPEYISRLAGVLDQRPEVILSYSDVEVTNVDETQEHWEFTDLDSIKSRLGRAMQMLKPVHMWWVPNRGLFRLENARRIGGLKTHGAGEFSADWPWLFHMCLLGQFARVPETLCFKHYKPGSLTRTWEFSKQQEHEVRAACLRELWNSSIPLAEKVRLSGPVTTWMSEKQAGLADRTTSDKSLDERTWLSGGARLVELQRHDDARGSLLPVEFDQLPFMPLRLFTVSDMPANTLRGGHAHRRGQQLLICLQGHIDVTARKDGDEVQISLLPDSPGLLVSAGVWFQQNYVVEGSMLLVLSSEPYDPESYIETEEETGR